MEVMVGSKGIASGSPYWTLEDYVMHLFAERKVGTPEFESVLKVYGKEKVQKIFEKWVLIKDGLKRE